jgi:hypothetical protein
MKSRREGVRPLIWLSIPISLFLCRFEALVRLGPRLKNIVPIAPRWLTTNKLATRVARRLRPIQKPVNRANPARTARALAASPQVAFACHFAVVSTNRDMSALMAPWAKAARQSVYGVSKASWLMIRSSASHFVQK